MIKMNNVSIHQIKEIKLREIYQLSTGVYTMTIRIEQEKGCSFDIILFSDNKEVFNIYT